MASDLAAARRTRSARRKATSRKDATGWWTSIWGIFEDLDKWIRHRLRALQLKQWKRGTTTFRELVARGTPVELAARIAANTRRWWHNSAIGLHLALPNRYFDQIGVPRLRP
jgi:hypothetical protein